MPLRLTAADWRAIFPRAPQPVIDAFASPGGTAALDVAGLTQTRTRLAYALANVEHECGGFTIPRLTENINYTAERMAKVWPNRFSSAFAVQSKYGVQAGWQKKAFDDIYGNRMGNRPDTHDGSAYIGRGGPQVTGRDGYREVGKRCGLDLENHPDLASAYEHQPAILAAFWDWKGMNRFADANDFRGAVRAWNGGSNGLADREHQMAGNDPIIKRLAAVNAIVPKVANVEAGKPAAAKPAASTAKKATAGTIAAGTLVAAGTVSKKPADQGGGFDWWLLLPILVVGASAALVTWFIRPRKQPGPVS